MAYTPGQTRQRLLVSAREEFLRDGFIGANLRRIAARANVTTGALYAHFVGKEDLFVALVRGPAEELVERFAKGHERVDNRVVGHEQDASAEETDWMLEFVYAHLDAFRLILTSAQGTTYEHYLDSLVDIEAATMERALAAHPQTGIAAVGRASGGEQVSPFFIRVTATSGIREMFEPVIHGLSLEDARQYLTTIKQFRFGGWRAVLDGEGE